MKSTIKQSKPKQFSIFDFVKAIIDTKQSWDTFTPEQQKMFSGYMINKFLSMNSKYIDIINYVQGLNVKENRKLYEIYCWMIPQSKNTYSPFIKSNTKSLVLPELTKYISEHFECSTSEAEEYIMITGKDFVEDILVKRGLDEKEIKKLLKNG
jgi:hypothetical protein